ncbi:MAG: nitrophenyl compound nitroreductase subunit ArsF family protein [Candidatus Sumerlaeia bacterium]|nr:nitrophenyl compound nitroreductase subunit ArsF family protein [Candidatus Sumerlaeia bacterium]
MNAKSFATAALLAFVAATIGAAILKEFRAAPAPPAAERRARPAGGTAEPLYAAYYFHGNIRCETCTTIEELSSSTLERAFAAELDSGRLEWRLVNYDEPANEHFREDFQLAFQSLVLVEERGGAVARWTNLKDVWVHVQDTPEEFGDYVVSASREFMGGAPE